MFDTLASSPEDRKIRLFFSFLLLFHLCACVRGALSRFDFPGDDTPIIRGSALAAATGGDDVLGRQVCHSCNNKTFGDELV